MKNQKILNKLYNRLLFIASDARDMGIPSSRLSYYVKIHQIERIGRGVYRSVSQKNIDTDFQWEDLVITAKSVPKSVICLISALAIYKLTDEIQRTYWIAIPHTSRAPNGILSLGVITT